MGNLTLFDHLLDRACRVDFHCREVIEPVDFGSIFGELLTKCIGQVMSWIRGLNKKLDFNKGSMLVSVGRTINKTDLRHFAS